MYFKHHLNFLLSNTSKRYNYIDVKYFLSLGHTINYSTRENIVKYIKVKKFYHKQDQDKQTIGHNRKNTRLSEKVLLPALEITSQAFLGI